MMAVEDEDISYHGSIESKRSRHVTDFAKGMLDVPNGPLVEADVYIGIWR